MNKHFDRKTWVALIVFIVGISFAIGVIYNEYSKMGCVYLIQKVGFIQEYAVKNPDGSTIYPWNSGHKCILNRRGVILLFGVGLAGLATSFKILQNRKATS